MYSSQLFASTALFLRSGILVRALQSASVSDWAITGADIVTRLSKSRRAMRAYLIKRVVGSQRPVYSARHRLPIYNARSRE